MAEPNSNQDSDDHSIVGSDQPNNGAEEEASPSAGSAAPNPSAAEEAGSHADQSEPDASNDTTEVEELHFEDDNLGKELRHASEDQLDNASFGIIKVDDEGVVEFFNKYESDLSGMDPDDVEGRNFFTQVAPCTNNRLFRGRFKKGIRRGELDETFTYTYTYKMRPTLVDVHLFRDQAGNNWITVQKY